MTFLSHVGSFNSGTGAISTTVAVTGVGFTPKAILFWWAGRADSTDAIGRANKNRGFGVATSATARGSMATSSNDASASSNSSMALTNAHCVITVSTATNAITGQLDLQSMDADGFTLVVDFAMPIDVRVHYLALGGDSLTNANVLSFTSPTATGNQDTTGVGFQPDCVLYMTVGHTTAIPAASAYENFTVGAAVSSSAQGVLMAATEDNVATMDTFSYCTDDEVIAISSVTDTAVVARADFVSFLADGFRLNWVEVLGTARQIVCLALKGGNYAVGNLLTQTDTVTDIVETGLGFQPTSALFFSHGQAKSTTDTAQSHDRTSIGAFSGVTTRGAQGALDEDNVADSEVTTAIEFDEVYVNIALDSTIDGLMDVKSIDSDGFTMIMDNADPVQAFVWYVAFGLAAVAGGQPMQLKGTTVPRMRQWQPKGLRG